MYIDLHVSQFSSVAQSCPTLWDPVDCSPPGSSVHGILQARVLEWVAISFSRGSSRPRDWIQVSRIAGRHFNLWATREALYLHISLAAAAAAKSLQLCPTLCDPMDCSPPGSSVHGFLRARILKWVVISSSRGSSRPRDWTCISHWQADSLPSEPPGRSLKM